jgi:hypothetical protein
MGSFKRVPGLLYKIKKNRKDGYGILEKER